MPVGLIQGARKLAGGGFRAQMLCRPFEDSLLKYDPIHVVEVFAAGRIELVEPVRISFEWMALARGIDH